MPRRHAASSWRFAMPHRPNAPPCLAVLPHRSAASLVPVTLPRRHAALSCCVFMQRCHAASSSCRVVLLCLPAVPVCLVVLQRRSAASLRRSDGRGRLVASSSGDIVLLRSHASDCHIAFVRELNCSAYPFCYQRFTPSIITRVVFLTRSVSVESRSCCVGLDRSR